MSGLALHTDGLVIQLANMFVSLSVSRQGTSWAGSWRPYMGAISRVQDAARLSLSRAPVAAPLARPALQRAAQPRVLSESNLVPRKSRLPILLCSTGTRTASFRRHTSDCCWTPSTATSSTLSAGACLPGRCVWQLVSPSSTFAPACLQRSTVFSYTVFSKGFRIPKRPQASPSWLLMLIACMRCHRDELRAAWSIFTPLLHTLDDEHVKPLPYVAGAKLLHP